MRRPAVRWTLRALLVAAVALGGLILGLRLAGPMERDTALGVVSLRVSPSLDGKVDAFIPLADWGIRADAFRAPLVVHVEPRTIDRQAVIRAAGGDRAVLAAAQRDAQDAAADALLRAALWALAGAAAAALLVAGVRRSIRLGGAVLLVAALIAGGSVMRTQQTFDARAFEAPSFYARGAELGQLLKVAGRTRKTKTGAYRSQVDRTLSSYAALLTAGGGRGLAPAGQRAVLVSDLHANTLVLDTVERLATGSPVFFAGDFAQSGSEAEARLLVEPITALGQVVAVSGNHDSASFMRALETAGATVLETEDPPLVVAGVTVAGYSDPLESRSGDPNDPDRIFSFSELPDFEERWAQAKQDVVTWFRALTPRPDVVLIHHNGLAQALAAALQEDDGPPLTILSGHDHIQHVDLYGNTLVIDAGTVGAGGILGAGKDAVGIAQLELAGAGAFPQLVDLVELEPLSGAAEADRVLPNSTTVCDHEAVECHEPEDEPPDEPVDPPEDDQQG